MVTNNELKKMADKLRVHSMKMTTASASGHPTTCMSIAEIMSTLFFSQMKKGDEIILSKGHAVPILWAAYAEAGLIDKPELMNLRKITSNLEGHPTPNQPLIKVATGSLGQGLNSGAGMGLGLRLKRQDNNVYVILGDGEVAEGSVWEAANTAAYYKLTNLIAIVDVNRLAQSQATMFGHDTKKYKDRFEAFGWNTVVVDGHDIQQLLDAYQMIGKDNKPLAVIAKTYKGKGVSFLEDKEGWHGKPLKKDELKKALEEIGDTQIELKSDIGIPENLNYQIASSELNKYELGEKIATRNAFGSALVEIGKINNNIVCIDGDTKNSTMTIDFFKQFPERSFDAYIAEQNMVGISTGLCKVGFVPFASTFGAFFTRAYDFIRMAAYSRANIKLVGSHAGVSIGEDGPSQMGLEDMQMFLPIPNAVVLYPCDAVSTENLTFKMAEFNGISYMKTTRGKTSVLYDNNESFEIGGLKVLKKSNKDNALLIGAGITVHEALKAYEELKIKGKNVRVIDLYSIKPIDKDALKLNADECNNNVIVIEDNYYGAIGNVVSSVIGPVEHLYIKQLPRSGSPQDLMEKYKIDKNAIIQKVMSL